MGKIAPPLEYDLRKSHLIHNNDVKISQDVNIATPDINILNEDQSTFESSEKEISPVVADPGPSIDSPKTIAALQQDLHLGIAKEEMRTRSSENSVLQVWNEGSEIHSRINSRSNSFRETDILKTTIPAGLPILQGSCCKNASIGYGSPNMTRWFSGSETGSHSYPSQTFTIVNPKDGCQYSWALFGTGSLSWNLVNPWAIYSTPNQTTACQWSFVVVLYSNQKECDRVTVIVDNHSFFYVKRISVGRVTYRSLDGTTWYTLPIWYYVACDGESGVQIGLPPSPLTNKRTYCWLGGPPFLHDDLDHLFDFDLEVEHIATFMEAYSPGSTYQATYHEPYDADVLYNQSDVGVQACCNPNTW